MVTREVNIVLCAPSGCGFCMCVLKASTVAKYGALGVVVGIRSSTRWWITLIPPLKFRAIFLDVWNGYILQLRTQVWVFQFNPWNSNQTFLCIFKARISKPTTLGKQHLINSTII